MSLNDDFRTFLSDIEPSHSTVEEISRAQNTLRDYLMSHPTYSSHCQDSYLSGSYAKHTAIRPVKDEDNRDVDIDVETDFDLNDNPLDVLHQLSDTLDESEKYSPVKMQSHSVGISLSRLDIDVVPLASDGNALYIGNSETGQWTETDPKGHKVWSSDFNKSHGMKYKPLVKAIKWWRREHCPAESRWPKGITLEKIIADSFPEENGPYAEMFTSVFHSIHDAYHDMVVSQVMPCIQDPAVPANDLAAGYTLEDFAGFLEEINKNLDLLENQGSNNATWRSILGNRFPSGDQENQGMLSESIYLPIYKALSVSWRSKTKWKIAARGYAIQVYATVETNGGDTFTIGNNDRLIPKDSSITYHALRSPRLGKCHIKWQIVNTGREAQEAECLRGEFQDANSVLGSRREETAYAGKHYVQCFAIRNGVCVARSKEFFINVAE